MAALIFFIRVGVLYESPLRRPPTGNSVSILDMISRCAVARFCDVGERPLILYNDYDSYIIASMSRESFQPQGAESQ